MAKVRATRADVLWSYVGTAFSMANAFLLLPFLLAFLTADELGLWYVFVATGGVALLFEFGFTPTFARNITYCWSGAVALAREGRGARREAAARDAGGTCDAGEACDAVDPHAFACVVAACRMVYRWVALIACVALATAGTAYVLFVGAQAGPGVIGAWAIYAAAVAFNLYFLYYSSLLKGIGLVAVESKVRIASCVVQLAVSAVLLAAGFGLLGAALGYLARSVVYRAAGWRAFWSRPEIRRLGLRGQKVSRAERLEVFRTVRHNALRDGLVMVANYASTQAATIVCSLFLTLAQTGAFSISLQFATAVGNLSIVFLGSLRPTIQSAYQRGDVALVRTALGRGVVVYVALYAVGTLAVLLLAGPLIALVKPGAAFDPLLYAGMAAYLFLFNWHSLFSSVLASMNTIPYMPAYVATAAVGVGLAALLAGPAGWGAWGLVTGFALPQLAYNNWKWPHVATRALGTTVRETLREGWRAWTRR